MCKRIGILAAALALAAAFGSAQTIHNFSGVPDGLNPFGGLAVGQNGELYGTTEYGGNSSACQNGSTGCGAVFELKPPSSLGGAWEESVIYSFPYFAYSLAAPTVGRNGKVYGTTYYGGHGVGNVFELTPPSSPGGAWTGKTLYSFSGAYGDPQNPAAGVVFGDNGVIYGTVQYAGLSPNCPWTYGSRYGCGGVYSLTPPASPGGAWTEQTLYIFKNDGDGAVPVTNLAIGKHGELYGVTTYGGASTYCGFGTDVAGCGVVFELDPPTTPGGAWTETVLYSFSGGQDGGYPHSVVYDGKVLYGTVRFGGDLRYCGGFGCGGVFLLSPPAYARGPWTESVLYSFKSVPDGLYPSAGVIIGRDGKLYGTTRDGGDSKSCPESPGCGVVFELTPPFYPNDIWRERVLHRFTADDGFWPTAGLVFGKDGELHGTALYGGTSTTCPAGGCGAVFKVDRNGDGDGRRH